MVRWLREIKIHGAYVQVRAKVVQLDMLSAHTDRAQLLNWLEGMNRS